MEKRVNASTPLVSICCQTFNHRNFIEEAVNSFLMQKTDFTYEILLRDDASTDGTQEIVKEFADQYPDIINPLIYSENQFKKGVKPFSDNVKRAKGKYIAMCEGDDYWTDPNKLQSQIDSMEKHDVGFSFHAAEIYKYNQNEFQIDKSSFFYGEDIKILSNAEIIDNKGQTIKTPLPSFVFKKELIDQLKSKHPEFYLNNMQHSFILLWAAYCDKILYIPKYMAVYRQAHTESWSYKMKSDFTFKKDYNLKIINSYNAFNKMTQSEFSFFIEKNINNRIFSVLKNIYIPIKDRIDFFKETNEYSSNKNKVLWFFIFKRKNVHQFVNWLFKSYQQLLTK
ncbi:glycosyltransferase family 2 protein [Psychroserpens sp.]